MVQKLFSVELRGFNFCPDKLFPTERDGVSLALDFYCIVGAKVAMTASLMMDSGFIDGGGVGSWRRCLMLISYCHLCGECFNELVELFEYSNLIRAGHVKEGNVKQENRGCAEPR